MAGIATGLLAINGWRDNYIRYGSAWHPLQAEKYHYLTRATADYSGDEEIAAKTFASRVEHLVMDEVSGWRALMQRPIRLNATDDEDNSNKEQIKYDGTR